MDLILPAAQEFAEIASSAESPLLQRLNRDTLDHVSGAQMLSGHLQGTFLMLISKMIRPKTILEIGTFTGYSAICMAEGLAEGGHLDTIDSNAGLLDMCNKYFREAGLQEKIRTHTGDALEILPNLKGKYDLVFIDADKSNYSRYYDLVFDKLPSGGIILADNLLFHGETLQASNLTEQALALISFRDKVKADKRVEQVLLTIRDGLLVVRKK
jgi:caffeoyl-CoA O-methyltransferase